jgi:hypothetical protein
MDILGTPSDEALLSQSLNGMKAVCVNSKNSYVKKNM